MLRRALNRGAAASVARASNAATITLANGVRLYTSLASVAPTTNFSRVTLGNAKELQQTLRSLDAIHTLASTSTQGSVRLFGDAKKNSIHVKKLLDLPIEQLQNKVVFVRVDFNVAVSPTGSNDADDIPEYVPIRVD